jgi:hypothetical protein
VIYIFHNDRFARISAKSEPEARAILHDLLRQQEEDITQWKLLYATGDDWQMFLNEVPARMTYIFERHPEREEIVAQSEVEARAILSRRHGGDAVRWELVDVNPNTRLAEGEKEE